MKIINQRIFDFAVVQLSDNSIIKIEFLENTTIGLREARYINDAIGDINNYEESLVVMLSKNTTHFTSDAREFSASEEGLKYTTAEALVTKNLAQKLMASFYLKINKPSKPSKAFNSEKEAINWLLSLKNIKT